MVLLHCFESPLAIALAPISTLNALTADAPQHRVTIAGLPVVFLQVGDMKGVGLIVDGAKREQPPDSRLDVTVAGVFAAMACVVVNDQ